MATSPQTQLVASIELEKENAAEVKGKSDRGKTL